MKTIITSVNIKYSDDVVNNAEIHFEMEEKDYSVIGSGYFIFERDQFEGKTVAELTEMVKNKYVERIMSPFEEDNEDEDDEELGED